MNFTRLDLPITSGGMINFITANCEKLEDRHISNNIYGVYSTADAKQVIQKKIDKYKDENRMQPHVKKWKVYKQILEKMEKEHEKDNRKSS